MNAPSDPKTVKPVQVTTGSLPGSRKIYFAVEGKSNIAPPFREVSLHESSGEAPFRIYDTSGPYGSDDAKIDVNAGLERIREPWVKARAVETYAGRDVKPEDNGNVSDAHRARELPVRHAVYRSVSAAMVRDGLRPPHHEDVPHLEEPQSGVSKAGQSDCITQLEFARAGTITEEMIYIAHRENLGRSAAL